MPGSHHVENQEQTPQVAELVRDYFRASDSGDSQLARKVLYPGAVMFSVVDGELHGVTQPRWWAQLEATNSLDPADSREILHLDVDGPSAIVKAVSRWADHEVHEYLLLLRAFTGWSIVASVSHGSGPSAGSTRVIDGESVAAATAMVQSKIDSHWTYDAEALGESHDPRATYFTIVEGTLVADSVAEWQRRYAQERRAGRLPASDEWLPTWVDTVGDAAGAKAVITREDGGRVVDYFVLLRLKGTWRIIDVTWVFVAPTS